MLKVLNLDFLHPGADMAQAPLTTFHILRAWAAALKSDRALEAWAQQHFQKSFALWIGADMSRPPEEADAPFIALFPDQCQTGKERTANRHELGLVIGVADEVMTDVDGVQEMRGLLRLDEAWPRVQAALDMALPDAVPQEPTVEYELAQYPLVMLLVTVIVEQRLPIGGRIGGPIFGPRQQKSGGA